METFLIFSSAPSHRLVEFQPSNAYTVSAGKSVSVIILSGGIALRGELCALVSGDGSDCLPAVVLIV